MGQGRSKEDPTLPSRETTVRWQNHSTPSEVPGRNLLVSGRLSEKPNAFELTTSDAGEDNRLNELAERTALRERLRRLSNGLLWQGSLILVSLGDAFLILWRLFDVSHTSGKTFHYCVCFTFTTSTVMYAVDLLVNLFVWRKTYFLSVSSAPALGR